MATHAQKFDEILKVASLTNHQVGTHYVVVSDKTLDKMSQPQKDALFKAIHDIRAENRKCVDDETEKVLDGWRGDSSRTVVEIDQVDRAGLHHQGRGVLQHLLQGREPRALQEHPGVRLTVTGADAPADGPAPTPGPSRPKGGTVTRLRARPRS